MPGFLCSPNRDRSSPPLFVAHKVQPYAAYALSQTAGEEMDESYAAIAELINAEPDEITIGPSTTLNFYVLAQGLRSLLRRVMRSW